MSHVTTSGQRRRLAFNMGGLPAEPRRLNQPGGRNYGQLMRDKGEFLRAHISASQRGSQGEWAERGAPNTCRSENLLDGLDGRLPIPCVS